ncbi:MAG: hypothetical protein IJE27_00235 [Anaerotignum sp.]|nr:hypothetical protein [Anaerotignum sp.]
MQLSLKDKMIVTILVVLAVVVFIGGRMHASRTGFETEKWVNYEGNSRQLMLQDLVDRTRFVGMTREEVKEELGEAEEETEEFLIYYAGIPQGLFGTKAEGEVEYLVIEFTDEDNKDLVTASGVKIADLLPKDSIFRIKGEATDNTLLTPTENE